MTELYLEETCIKILKWYTECFCESFQIVPINYTSWTPNTDIFNSYLKEINYLWKFSGDFDAVRKKKENN